MSNQAAIEEMTLTQALETHGFGHRRPTEEERLDRGLRLAYGVHIIFRKSDGKVMGAFDHIGAWKWLKTQISFSEVG